MALPRSYQIEIESNFTGGLPPQMVAMHGRTTTSELAPTLTDYIESLTTVMRTKTTPSLACTCRFSGSCTLSVSSYSSPRALLPVASNRTRGQVQTCQSHTSLLPAHSSSPTSCSIIHKPRVGFVRSKGNTEGPVRPGQVVNTINILTLSLILMQRA